MSEGFWGDAEDFFLLLERECGCESWEGRLEGEAEGLREDGRRWMDVGMQCEGWVI